MCIFCIFWNSSGVLHYRLYEKGLAVNLDVYYYELNHVVDKCRPHYDKTVKSCGYKRLVHVIFYPSVLEGPESLFISGASKAFKQPFGSFLCCERLF